MLTAESAQHAIDALTAWPVVPLGNWPTPVQRVQHPELGELLVKRDDQAGFGRLGVAGVKARKLEGFLGDVRLRGYDEVVMPLANMTNLAFDLAPVLRDMRIRARLVIVDNPPLARRERLLLFDEIMDDVQLVGQSTVAALACVATATATASVNGRRPLAVLPSPGHPGAVVGAARGFLEMASQQLAAGQSLPSRVFISAAAGVTVAGFALAEFLLRATGVPAMRIVAVQVGPYALRRWVPCLLEWTRRRLGVCSRIPLDQLEFLRLPDNLAFGRFNNRLEQVCERVLSDVGLVIDPLYGGKAWSAMEQYLRHPSGKCDRPAMYWHCGYSPDWRAFRTSRA